MLTIGRLARQFGLSRSTLLYYDSIGLLSPSGRSKGDYRLYGEEDVKRLARICAYREAGISLKDIIRLLDAPRESELAEVLEQRLEELAGAMDTLRNQQRIVAGLLGRAELPGPESPMDKKIWTDLLAAAGFSEQDMRSWHIDFERTNPQKHKQFLDFLNIPEKEQKIIRTWGN